MYSFINISTIGTLPTVLDINNVPFQDKCGNKLADIWPYIRQEIKPTLDELGILTPEDMGYDKPELALQSVYDIH